MNFWYPLIVTEDSVVFPTIREDDIVIQQDNIRRIDTESTTVVDEAGHSRSASLIDIRLISPDLVVPIAIRSMRWNALIRLTANDRETVSVQARLQARLMQPGGATSNPGETETGDLRW